MFEPASRILVKLSGEALSGPEGAFSPTALQRVAEEIAPLSLVETAVVVGGGNILRGARSDAFDRIEGDTLGMLATVLNALAWIEAACDIEKLRNPEQAIERALLACGMTDYRTAEVVDTLAVAYAAAGKFREAIETANKAMRAAESAGNTALARRIRSRLDLYKAEKPFRDSSLADDTSQ